MVKKEEYFYMRKQLEQYIRIKLNTLKYKGDIIQLENVYPSLLENIIEDLTPYELNGYDCDYWANTDKYEISGCMRFGTAKITLKIGKEKLVEKDIIKEEYQEPIILKKEDISKDILSQLQIFYFTFGSGQRYEGYCQPIMAKNNSIAHKKMCEVYGTKWSFMYDKEKWEDISKYYINKELETIVAL